MRHLKQMEKKRVFHIDNWHLTSIWHSLLAHSWNFTLCAAHSHSTQCVLLIHDLGQATNQAASFHISVVLYMQSCYYYH